MRSEYPSGTDLAGLFSALGLFSATELAALLVDIDLDTIAGAAVSEFERLTGWIPFLGDAADVTRYFDPAGPNQRLPGLRGGGYLLNLETGLLAVTSIHSGFSAADAGTAQVLETDYRLRPLNALVEGRPYTEVEFLGGWSYGLGRSIRIIGRWGYGTTIPDDVWLAILHRGGYLTLPLIQERFTGGVESFTELGVTEKYGPTFLTGEAGVGGRWAMEWERITRRYTRVVI